MKRFARATFPFFHTLYIHETALEIWDSTGVMDCTGGVIHRCDLNVTSAGDLDEAVQTQQTSMAFLPQFANWSPSILQLSPIA